MESKYNNLDPGHYKWGIFYFNPQDNRVMVPKNNQWMGYTVNFAQPMAWLVIFLIIAVAVSFSFLG